MRERRFACRSAPADRVAITARGVQTAGRIPEKSKHVRHVESPAAPPGSRRRGFRRCNGARQRARIEPRPRGHRQVRDRYVGHRSRRDGPLDRTGRRLRPLYRRHMDEDDEDSGGPRALGLVRYSRRQVRGRRSCRHRGRGERIASVGLGGAQGRRLLPQLCRHRRNRPSGPRSGQRRSGAHRQTQDARRRRTPCRIAGLPREQPGRHRRQSRRQAARRVSACPIAITT